MANDIANEKKVAVLLTVIGTKAYTLLRNIVAPDKSAAKEYDQLVEAFRAHLDPKSIIIAERFKFHRRNQREGKSIAQYIAELRKLSKHCDFREFLDQALRDRLVCGLTSEATQKQLLAEMDLTLAKAQEIAVGMEAAAKQTNKLRVSSKANKLRVSSKGLELNMVTVDNLKPCFRCAKKGYAPENCSFKRQKCRNCGKQGHTYKVCRAPPPTEPTNPTEKSQPTPPQAGTHPQKHQNYFVESEELGLFTVKDAVHSGILIDLSINGTPITMALDTGASISIISEKTYKTQLTVLQN